MDGPFAGRDHSVAEIAASYIHSVLGDDMCQRIGASNSLIGGSFVLHAIEVALGRDPIPYNDIDVYCPTDTNVLAVFGDATVVTHLEEDKDALRAYHNMAEIKQILKSDPFQFIVYDNPVDGVMLADMSIVRSYFDGAKVHIGFPDDIARRQCFVFEKSVRVGAVLWQRLQKYHARNYTFVNVTMDPATKRVAFQPDDDEQRRGVILQMQVEIRQLKAVVTAKNQSMVLAKRAIDRYRRELTCCVCMDRKIECVAKPCGHMFCEQCLQQMGRCPKCKGDVGGHMRIYL